MVTKIGDASCGRMRNHAYTEEEVRSADPPRAPGMKLPVPPTARQQAVLDFVRRYMRTHGVAPSRTEIARAIGLSHPSTADHHLMTLMKKGWLVVRPNQARYIRLLHEDLPVVRAGPIEPEQPLLDPARVVGQMARNVADRFDPPPDCFVQVHDNTLQSEGLAAGDLVAVHATSTIARTDDIVLIREGSEIMLRRLHQAGAHCIEQPPAGTAHATHAGQSGHDDVRIEGVMVGALIGRRRPSAKEERKRASE